MVTSGALGETFDISPRADAAFTDANSLAVELIHSEWYRHVSENHFCCIGTVYIQCTLDYGEFASAK